jgi:hypothetical protein
LSRERNKRYRDAVPLLNTTERSTWEFSGCKEMWGFSFSLLMSLEKEDLRNLGRKLVALLGEMSDRLSRDLDLLGITSVPASSTLDTDPTQICKW